MIEKEFIEVDELDFRLGLNDLLSVHGKIDIETNKLINRVIAETKRWAIKDALKTHIEQGISMTHNELVSEEHRSERLGRFLEASGYDKPSSSFEAHAIISGRHIRAQVACEILAQFNIRIDDPSNGLWLPNFSRNIGHYPAYTTAHRNIHRKIYYLNITACLEQAMTPLHARAILRRVAQGIVTGSFPIDRQIRSQEIMEFAKGKLHESILDYPTVRFL